MAIPGVFVWELQLRSRTAWKWSRQPLFQFPMFNQHLALSSLTRHQAFPALLQVKIKHKNRGIQKEKKWSSICDPPGKVETNMCIRTPGFQMNPGHHFTKLFVLDCESHKPKVIAQKSYLTTRS